MRAKTLLKAWRDMVQQEQTLVMDQVHCMLLCKKIMMNTKTYQYMAGRRCGHVA